MDISNRIKKIIEYYGYSPSEFADAIDVARSSISHITSGRNKASLDFIIKIKNRFPEIRWDWLIEGQGEMTNLTSKQQHNNLFNEIDTEQKKTFTNVNSNKRDLFSTAPENFNSSTEELKPVEDARDIEKQDKSKNITRIVFFFEDGKFEIFTP